jgi:hypothetical protein
LLQINEITSVISAFAFYSFVMENRPEFENTIYSPKIGALDLLLSLLK